MAESVMRGQKPKDPDKTVIRYVSRMASRLFPGVKSLDEEQRAEAVREIIGCEPILLDAAIVRLVFDERSKWFGRVGVMETHRILQDLHFALHPAPLPSRRRVGDEQFELNFEWANGVAQLVEAAE